MQAVAVNLTKSEYAALTKEAEWRSESIGDLTRVLVLRFLARAKRTPRYGAPPPLVVMVRTARRILGTEKGGERRWYIVITRRTERFRTTQVETSESDFNQLEPPATCYDPI